MDSAPSVAVVHYPEGAGHATRMLAVADALIAGGAEVSFAGGGAGTEFVARNGYDAFEPTAVDYIDTYQGGSGSLRRVLTRSVPATVARVTELIDWLETTEPDALVTDDMFAAMAAVRTDTPFYALKHDLPGLYDDRLERAGAAFHTDVQRTAAEQLFYPAVWPVTETTLQKVTPVQPVALTGEETPSDTPEVVVVPSHYSDLDRVAETLDALGYDVLNVGSERWEPVPSLLPYLRAADLVVCSGYSSVMDAAVAGTPCIVHPATDEQRAVADRIETHDVEGFAVAESPFEVLEAVVDPPEPPRYENGADAVASVVLDDLESRGEAGGDTQNEDRTRSTGVTERASSGANRVVTAGGRAAVGTAEAARAGVARGVDAGRTAVLAAGRSVRATAAGCRRYGTAAATLLLVTSVFVGGRTRRTGRSVGRSVLDGVKTVGSVLESTASGARRAAGRLRRAAPTVR